MHATSKICSTFQESTGEKGLLQSQKPVVRKIDQFDKSVLSRIHDEQVLENFAMVHSWTMTEHFPSTQYVHVDWPFKPPKQRFARI